MILAERDESRVLILRGGAVGDCVITTPVTRMIRAALPASHITLLGDPYSIGVFDGRDADRFVKVTPRDLRALLALRKERFDVSIDFHNNGRSRVQTLLAGAKRRIGFDKHLLQRIPYTEKVPFPRGVHAVERQTRLLASLGISSYGRPLSLNVPFTREHAREARSLLAATGIGDEPYAILLATTGTRRPQWRRWPPERFAELAGRITDELGLRVVVPARPIDLPAVEPILSAQDSIHPLIEPMSLRTLTTLIAGSSLYAGYNTGPMHLAAAHEVPIAAFFDIPSDVVEWYPWSNAPFEMVQPMKTCGHSQCKGRACLHSIEADAVFEAASRAVSRADSLATAPSWPRAGVAGRA